MTVPTTDTDTTDRRSLHERIAADLRDDHERRGDRRPIEATVMVKAGHLYELRYEFTSD
jgi:GntR family transcriptional regulator